MLSASLESLRQCFSFVTEYIYVYMHKQYQTERRLYTGVTIGLVLFGTLILLLLTCSVVISKRSGLSKFLLYSCAANITLF
jgi:hypothetical protein